MTTCRLNFKTLILWTALLCAPFAFADSDPILDPGGVESGFSIPQAPTFVPGAPPPPTQDRMKSQVAAKAMGMAAAAQQKIACFQMMSESMKEENKKNQGLMMAMAQQMCAQADQSMASAMKNEEGIKQVSQNDIPKMAEMKIAPVTLGKDKIKEAEVPTITFNDEATKGSGLIDFPAPGTAIVAAPEAGEQVFNKPSTTDDLKDPITKFTQTSTKLDAIDRNPAGVASEGEKGVAGSLAGLGLGGSGGVAGLPAKGASGSNESPTISESENLTSQRKRGGVLTAGTSGEGGGAAEKSGSGFDLSALMAQMMGGPAEGEGGPGLELITLNTQAPEEKPPNLFEYASFRYHQLSSEKGAIRRRKNQGIKVPHRGATIAQVSKIETEGDQKIDTLKHAGQ